MIIILFIALAVLIVLEIGDKLKQKRRDEKTSSIFVGHAVRGKDYEDYRRG